MEYQIWTRKANAVAAVEKHLSSFEIDPDILITGLEAIEHVEGFSITVHVEFAEGATIANDEFEAFKAAVGSKARLSITYPEPAEEEKKERKVKPTRERRARASERKLTCIEGKNPFRAGGKSHAAWEWLAANPGSTYAECVAAGCRMRAISHSISSGWIKVE